MTDRYNDGRAYGLPPIGMNEANLNTPGSDTERRPMPGLATKNSVFSWAPIDANLNYPVVVYGGTLVSGATYTVNLRNNASGASVDVPSWAAGAVLKLYPAASTMGTSTYHGWSVTSPVSTRAVFNYETLALPRSLGNQYQFIIPFYDEPLFTVTYTTDGTGTAQTYVYLIGFVRNV